MFIENNNRYQYNTERAIVSVALHNGLGASSKCSHRPKCPPPCPLKESTCRPLIICFIGGACWVKVT